MEQCEDLGEIVGFAGEVIDRNCLVLRLSLRDDLDDRKIELKMTADLVLRLATELIRVSTPAH